VREQTMTEGGAGIGWQELLILLLVLLGIGVL
jgi:hypothetical protein